MRTFALLAVVVLMACEPQTETAFQPLEGEFPELGVVVETKTTSSNRPFLDDERRPRHEADKRFENGIALASEAVDPEMAENSAVFEQNGIKSYMLRDGSIRLTDGSTTRDVALSADDLASLSSDGRVMVRTVHDMTWRIYALNGDDITFENPEGAIVFDIVADTVLVGHKHDGQRTLHKVVIN